MSTENAVLLGDCVEVMATLAAESVDAVVTDPPYDLTSGKRGGSGQASVNLDSPYGRARIGTGNGGGFMGKAWDSTGVAFDPATWAEALRVAKPGAYLLAFGGTRTYHRLACAVEDAGWEIRDTLVWAYAQGFPKSHNLPGGLGTALKPAWEPIVMARKPLIGTVVKNVLAYGTGALNIDGCRIGTTVETWPVSRSYAPSQIQPGGVRATQATGDVPPGRWPANVVLTATEWYTLRDDVDQSARDLILAFFEAQGMGDDGLPGLRQAVRDHPGVGARRSPEILLSPMQLEGIAGGEADGGPTPPGVDPDDAGCGIEGDRAALPRMEGRSVPRSERLRLGGALDPDRAGAGDGPGDAHEGQSLRSGAPASGGHEDRASAAPARGGSSPQRGEGRQPAGEPVRQGPVQPFAIASGDRPGVGAIAGAGRRVGGGERRLTVPLDLIPPGWRRYFDWSHDSGIFDGDTPGVVGGGHSADPPPSYVRSVAPATGIYGADNRGPGDTMVGYGDAGTYSRFFLVPKASRGDREPVLGGLELVDTGHLTMGSQPAGTPPPPPRRNVHPTVKPTELMRHLVRLVTPPGGLVLDPFLGSGTTALACEAEGFRWLGIEREAEYAAIAEARLNGTQRGMGLVG